MVNRRGFFSALLAAAVAPDPERLIWQPGRKLISIPATLHISGSQIAEQQLQSGIAIVRLLRGDNSLRAYQEYITTQALIEMRKRLLLAKLIERSELAREQEGDRLFLNGENWCWSWH